jgi:preprotein translocase subunit SecA
MKAESHVDQTDQGKEARRQRTARNYQEQKEESRSALAAPQNNNRPPTPSKAPVQSQKVASRNQRVNVQYTDGSVKKDVKYKTVEEDLKNNKCVLID